MTKRVEQLSRDSEDAMREERLNREAEVKGLRDKLACAETQMLQQQERAAETLQKAEQEREKLRQRCADMELQLKELHKQHAAALEVYGEKAASELQAARAEVAAAV